VAYDRRAALARGRIPEHQLIVRTLCLLGREEGVRVLQIAARLHISRSTAKTHLLRVYEKLEAPNRSAAVAIALGRGLLRASTAVA
jgi:DNA-binding NarL/FixJ family response regulator